MTTGNKTRYPSEFTGGHTTGLPVSITYSSVVSRYIVRISFILAVFNVIYLFAKNIGIAYFNTSCCEKIWTESGTDFGSQQGCFILIVRALYGLNSSGAS